MHVAERFALLHRTALSLHRLKGLGWEDIAVRLAITDKALVAVIRHAVIKAAYRSVTHV